MKTKVLKNEEDILFMLEHLHCFYISLGHDVQLTTEVVSSRSNTYSCRSLSDDQRLFPALI